MGRSANIWYWIGMRTGFSLNVPPTCRIWLKFNEVLMRWLRLPDSHYCLVIGCQAVDAILRYSSKLKLWNMSADNWTYDRFLPSLSMKWSTHHQHWICTVIFFSCFISPYVVRNSEFWAWLLCFIIPAQSNNMQHETVQYSRFRSKEIGLWMGPCNGHHPCELPLAGKSPPQVK